VRFVIQLRGGGVKGPVVELRKRMATNDSMF
jgi:hypothetical protein